MYKTMFVRKKWRVVDEQAKTVVTIERNAGVDQPDCKALAEHIAKFMNTIMLWS